MRDICTVGKKERKKVWTEEEEKNEAKVERDRCQVNEP